MLPTHSEEPEHVVGVLPQERHITIIYNRNGKSKEEKSQSAAKSVQVFLPGRGAGKGWGRGGAESKVMQVCVCVGNLQPGQLAAEIPSQPQQKPAQCTGILLSARQAGHGNVIKQEPVLVLSTRADYGKRANNAWYTLQTPPPPL